MNPKHQRCTRTRRRAFTLIELLVVISIIAILMGILLPALSTARRSGRIAVCGSQEHQIHLAMSSYLVDYKQVYFWRAADIGTDGMDWYVYGGRETGNVVVVTQNDLFNRFIPRPLNPYVNLIVLFQCPEDTVPWPDPLGAGRTHFGYVGNSYNFNATGATYDPNRNTGGLDEVTFDKIKQAARTVLITDASLAWYQTYPNLWHGDKGNITFADGHVIFTVPPSSADGAPYTYIP